MQHYLDQQLPLSGDVPLSRHCSALGALDALPRAGRQTRAYLELLAARGAHGATDWEAASLLGWERTTVNARRGPLIKGDEPWVMTTETRPGPTGIRNAVWTLTEAGQKAVQAMRDVR